MSFEFSPETFVIQIEKEIVKLRKIITDSQNVIASETPKLKPLEDQLADSFRRDSEAAKEAFRTGQNSVLTLILKPFRDEQRILEPQVRGVKGRINNAREQIAQSQAKIQSLNKNLDLLRTEVQVRTRNTISLNPQLNTIPTPISEPIPQITFIETRPDDKPTIRQEQPVSKKPLLAGIGLVLGAIVLGS